jgi:hypothetical protein
VSQIYDLIVQTDPHKKGRFGHKLGGALDPVQTLEIRSLRVASAIEPESDGYTVNACAI